MSNRLARRLNIDRTGIRNIRTIEDVVQWLDRDVRERDIQYDTLRDTINNFGMGTASWNIREASAADVTAGDAAAAGNLLVEHKTTGTKREFEP